MMQIESSRPSQARKAATQHVLREILPKKIETEQAKVEKAADHGTTKYVKAKKTEKTVNRQGGPVLKPEKNRNGRKSASEKSTALAKTTDTAAAPGQKTSDAAKSDAFDKFKDVVGKITEGAKLVTGLINGFKDVGVALKDFVSALKGELKHPAPPAPGPASGGIAGPTDVAGAKPAPAEPAAQAPANPAEALRQLRQTFDTLLSQFEELLKQLRSGLEPAKLGKKDEAKAWSGVSNGLGYPLTTRGEIADPEAFKLWSASLPDAPHSAQPAPPNTQPAPPNTQPAPPSPQPAPPSGGLKLDNPYRITFDERTAKTYVNTIKEPNIAPKPSWRYDVYQAMGRVQDKSLGIDPNDRAKITDWDTYHQSVANELRAVGYKAFYDGEELQVTRPGADHSEDYKISTSWKTVRHFYISHISPPAFE